MLDESQGHLLGAPPFIWMAGRGIFGATSGESFRLVIRASPIFPMVKEALNKSFDKLRTNGNLLIPFVVSLSNHERNQFVQRFLN